METYKKDYNGQAANPINDVIKGMNDLIVPNYNFDLSGLFFSVRTLSDGSLPPGSPFGEIRMVLPATTLLNPHLINMYFCDFYCNTRPHYGKLFHLTSIKLVNNHHTLWIPIINLNMLFSDSRCLHQRFRFGQVSR